VVNDGAEPRQFAREIVEYLRSLMLVKLGSGTTYLNLSEEMLEAMTAQAARTDGPTILRATSLFNNALVDIKSGLLSIAQLPLELAFVEAVAPVVESPEPEPVVAPPSGSEGFAAESAASPIAPPAAELPRVPKQVTSSGVEEEITVDTVRACLDQVLKMIDKKNKLMAEALRSQARLYKVDGKEIHFVTLEMMKKRFEKPQPKAAVDEAFTEVLGRPVTVRFLSDQAVSPVSQANSAVPVDDENLEALVKAAEELGGEVAN
jgi:DNA polymerase-3 subunit gamma/tau